MVTNQVAGLPENSGAWNMVLNAQGRIQGALTVWREGDHLELEIDANQYDHLMAHFDRFIIMDDVELVPLEGEASLGLTGPKVHEVLERLSLPTLSEPLTLSRIEWNGINLRIARLYGVLAEHYVLSAPEALLGKLWLYLRAAGAIAVGSQVLDAFRIAEGIPAYGIDMVERDLPQETSQMRALHFNKGCYLGQEIVERIHSRGNVHRHLRHLEWTGALPAAGTELHLETGAVAGQIRSAAELPLPEGSRVFALAMMRAEAEVGEPRLNSASGTGTARLLAAPPAF
jgi:folate-binding protein YgfZ